MAAVRFIHCKGRSPEKKLLFFFILSKRGGKGGGGVWTKSKRKAAFSRETFPKLQQQALVTLGIVKPKAKKLRRELLHLKVSQYFCNRFNKLDIIRLLRPLTVKDKAVFACDLYPIHAMYVKK